MLRDETLALLSQEYDAVPILERIRPRASSAAVHETLLELIEAAPGRQARLDFARSLAGWTEERPSARFLSGWEGQVDALLDGHPNGPVLDAAILALLLKISRLRTAGYEVACLLAEALDEPNLAGLLRGGVDGGSGGGRPGFSRLRRPRREGRRGMGRCLPDQSGRLGSQRLTRRPWSRQEAGLGRPMKSFLLLASLAVLSPTATALTLSLDDPIVAATAPVSGINTYGLRGIVALSAGETFAGGGASDAFDATGTHQIAIRSNGLAIGSALASANSYTRVLAFLDVDATDPADRYSVGAQGFEAPYVAFFASTPQGATVTSYATYAAAVAPAPEPASLSVVDLGLLVLVRRR